MFFFQVHEDGEYFTNSLDTEIELYVWSYIIEKIKKYFNGVEYEPVKQSGEANEE
jgi:hypothetical protein